MVIRFSGQYRYSALFIRMTGKSTVSELVCQRDVCEALKYLVGGTCAPSSALPVVEKFGPRVYS